MALTALLERMRIPALYQESPEQREKKVANHLQFHLDNAALTRRTFFEQISYYPSSRDVQLHKDAIKYALKNGWVVKITRPIVETFAVGEVTDVQFKEEGIVLIMQKNQQKIADHTWYASYNPSPHEVDLVQP